MFDAMPGPMLGQLLALGSAFSFALANNFIAGTTQSAGDKGVMFSVLVTMAMSALLWLVLESGQAGWPQGAQAWTGVAWFALAGVLAMVFGRTLGFTSIRRLGVIRSTAVKRLNPFFSVLLAALLLSEAISGLDLLGMIAIALSFALLIHDSRKRLAGDTTTFKPPPAAYLFGVFGALAYALAYVARKAGLEGLEAPAFGTLISAVTGFTVFVLLSPFSERHRRNLLGMFAHLDRWIVAGAVMVSLGQILLFAALAYEKVSTVVLIASLEIFVSMFLSVVVFKREAPPSALIWLAAVLAMGGVGLVALR